MEDPEATGALRELAMHTALLERAHVLLDREETEFLQKLEVEAFDDEEEAAFRTRLLSWYTALANAHAKRVGALIRYYSALHRKSDGVAGEGLQCSILAVARTLEERVPDPKLREEIVRDLRRRLDRIVAGPEDWPAPKLFPD